MTYRPTRKAYNEAWELVRKSHTLYDIPYFGPTVPFYEDEQVLLQMEARTHDTPNE